MGILGLFLVLLGEFLSITAEILFTKGKSFYVTFGIIIIGGLFLLLGYGLGSKYLKDIWLIYIVSITAILILEPIIIFILTKEPPHLGAKLGFLFGIIGFLCAYYMK